MSDKWNQKRQCRTCPWRRDVAYADVPDVEPGLYSRMVSTMASGPSSFELKSAMVCHNSESNAACVGWIHNQAGEGHNFAVRLAVARHRTDPIIVLGEQRTEDEIRSLAEAEDA